MKIEEDSKHPSVYRVKMSKRVFGNSPFCQITTCFGGLAGLANLAASFDKFQASSSSEPGRITLAGPNYPLLKSLAPLLREYGIKATLPFRDTINEPIVLGWYM